MSINTPYINDPATMRVLEQSMTGRLKYSLMNDFLSKYSLQNDLYALKGLLAALLRVHLDEITDIEILNPIEPADFVSDKNCVLDIKLILNNDKIINIEIQTVYQEFWPERSITYLCRNFDHLKAGESYDKIKPCVQIGILDKPLFHEDDERYTGEFYSEYEMLNVKTHTKYSSKFSIRVLSLSCLEAALDEDKTDSNSLYYWAKLFKADSWEELRMIAEENPRMESFVGTVRKLSAEEKVAQACEARRRYLQDVATYDSQIQALKDKVEDAKLELYEKNQELDEKNQELDEKNQELDEKNQELDEKNQELDEKNQELDEKNQELDEKNQELDEKNQELDAYKQKIAELEKKLASKE